MRRLMKKLEYIMSAVAFAEAGEHDTARAILQDEPPQTLVTDSEIYTRDGIVRLS